MNTITTDEYGSAAAGKLPGIAMLEPASQRGDTSPTASIVLYAPLALQKMVLAVWLILRGFNPPLPHRGLSARQVVTAAAVLATNPSREG